MDYWAILNEFNIPLSKKDNEISKNKSHNTDNHGSGIVGENNKRVITEEHNYSDVRIDNGNLMISEIKSKDIENKVINLDMDNERKESNKIAENRIVLEKDNNSDNNSEMQNEKAKLQILENLVNPEDRENLNCGIPEVIKYEGDFVESRENIYFYFVLNQNIAVICVANQFYEDLRKYLIDLLRQFQAIFTDERIILAKERIKSPKLIMKFSEIFAEVIVFDYLIPKFPNENNHLQDEEETEEISGLQSLILKLKDNIQGVYDFLPEDERGLNFEALLEFSNKIDGISDIKTISDKLKIPLTNFKRNMLFLWMNKKIELDIPVYDWEIFERTHKANVYLLDGSDEQKGLIQKHGGGKIISLLSRFDGKLNLSELKKKINITELKFTRFIYELLNENLIVLCESYPKMKHIEEDIIPLLIMQGLSDEDITIIELLEYICDGTKTITEIAINLDQSPEKIKTILGKIPEYVKYV